MPAVLTTERLILRPLTVDDAPTVERYAGAYEVALNTLRIPHPYPAGAAAEWIASHTQSANAHVFAQTLRETGEMIGSIGLHMDLNHDSAEIGYWLGVPFWGKGYVTEAARAVVGWAFATLPLNRIHAGHFTRNPASGRVLQKLGMKHEGTHRQSIKKWGEYLDIEMYAILRGEWSGA